MNLNIYEQVRRVPDNAKKTIGAGRLKGMTDINPMWRIKVLTEMFGACGFGWYYKVTSERTEQYEDEICVFVDLELYIKYNGEWSMPIHGTGGSKLATKERNGVYVSDECFKMATTDALSVACKQLGIGADVYWNGDNNSKYKTNTANDYKQEEKMPLEQAMRCSEKQITYIKNLCRGSKDKQNFVCNYLKDSKCEQLSQLDITQATEVIAKLKEM